MDTTQRFKDENLYLWHFTGKVLVHCPKCHGKAYVQSYSRKCKCKADISCTQCGYYAIHDWVYYSLEFGRNCPQCGKRIEFKIDNISANNKKESMKIPCPHCRFTENYNPQYIEHKVRGGDIENGKDGYFNADLWLQKDFRGNLFWAANYTHLDYLKEYIRADLRQRNDMPHMTMIAKLPKFIKAHKNRDDLLKVIKQLQNK